MRRSFAIIAMLVALAVLFTTAPTAARSRIALGLSDPKGQNMAAVQTYIERYGQKPAMWSLWSTWGSRGGDGVCNAGENCAFPTEMVNQLMDMGITPVIWWQYSHANGSPTWRYSYRNLLKGNHDPYIRQWAKGLKAASKRAQAKFGHRRRIIIRPFHEATGSWFPWGIGYPGNTFKTYKRAWRHLDRQFRVVGARKYALFMWSNYTPSRRAYPGDKFVDYVGFTVLNWGSRRKWRPMTPQVAKKVQQAAKFTKKPLIIAENASFHRGGNKAYWLRSGYLKTFRRFPKVKGILYLDADLANDGKHPNWKLIMPKDGATLDDGSAVRAYRWLSRKAKFKGVIR